MRYPRFLLVPLAFAGALLARETQPLPPGVPADYVGHLAPEPKGLLLKTGDRYAICGDSITEQKMYSRLLEAYLAAARPDLQVECRQYGWSGETAGGFFGRMKNDVLRFRPTIASTCYGMNDFRYVPFEKSIWRGLSQEPDQGRAGLQGRRRPRRARFFRHHPLRPAVGEVGPRHLADP